MVSLCSLTPNYYFKLGLFSDFGPSISIYGHVGGFWPILGHFVGKCLEMLLRNAEEMGLDASKVVSDGFFGLFSDFGPSISIYGHFGGFWPISGQFWLYCG